MKIAAFVPMLPLNRYLALEEAEFPPTLTDQPASQALSAVCAISLGYANRVAAHLRPNITYADQSADNPVAESK